MAVKVVASSNLKVNGTGLSLSTSSYVNNGATATDAPVLLSVQADKVYTATEFAAAVAAANTDMNAAQVARILNAMNEAVIGFVEDATDAPTIDLGWGKFVFEIGGSLDTASATPTLIDNPCYFSGQVASKYQAQFRLIKASTDVAASPCDLKRIRDKASSALNMIFGHKDFYADGRGLKFGATGDKQELWNETMTQKVCDLALDSAKSYDSSLALKIPNTLTTTIAVGTYWVVIDCAIDGTVYHMTKKVTLAEAATPPPMTITLYKQNTKADNCVEFDDHVGGKGVTVTGTNLAGFNRARGDTFIFHLIENGVVTDTSNNSDDVTGSTDTTVLCANGLYPNGEAFTVDAWYGKTGKLLIKINGQTVEHPVSFVAP